MCKTKIEKNRKGKSISNKVKEKKIVKCWLYRNFSNVSQQKKKEQKFSRINSNFYGRVYDGVRMCDYVRYSECSRRGTMC